MDRFVRVMEEVYGKYTPGRWTPKPYKGGKGRYLWTDAFGVCNFITMFYETGDKKYLDQAEILIENVHNTLGRERVGSKRLGDSTDEEPLKGGLRIGKPDPEGAPDGDGQYFHYLTKWMFALNRMSRAKGNPIYNNWAIQMAEHVHPHFVWKDSKRPRMFWKISIDMSKPHVMSEGNLDPFDGYITYRILRETSSNPNVLKNEIEDMRIMVEEKYSSYHSNDPLDLGEALWIAHWYPHEPWAKLITSRSLSSLEKLYQKGYFNVSPQYRLAFREFGATIGVQVNEAAGKEWNTRTKNLNDYWENNIYIRDRDISPVMFCTSLNPGVFSHKYPSKASH